MDAGCIRHRVGGQTSIPKIRSGGQTTIPKISTGGQTSIPKISSEGQMSRLHFQPGGKCPFILFFIGGEANVLGGKRPETIFFIFISTLFGKDCSNIFKHKFNNIIVYFENLYLDF